MASCARPTLQQLEASYSQAFAKGNYPEAAEAAGQMLAAAERHHSRESDAYADALNKLGLAEFRMMELFKAEEHHELAVRTYEAIHGRQHESVARSLSYLSQVYFAENRLDWAIETGKVSMNIYITVCGPDHFLSASQMNSVARMCEHDGRHNEARLLFARALTALRLNMPANHPAVAAVSNNLSRLLQADTNQVPNRVQAP